MSAHASTLRAIGLRRRDAVASGSAIAVVTGLLALAVRPVGWTGTGITLAVGAAGTFAVLPSRTRTNLGAWSATFAGGATAFLLARFVIVGPTLPTRVGLAGLAASIGAAVAEEAFFRRLLYGRLEERGTAFAVAGSALAFALVHVPAYGLHVLPLDLAAGALLSWQRASSGTWTAPAATHVLANLLAIF